MEKRLQKAGSRTAVIFVVDWVNGRVVVVDGRLDQIDVCLCVGMFVCTATGVVG